MAKTRKPQRRTRYKIQPLGIVVLVLILLIIIGGVFLIVKHFAGGSDKTAGDQIVAEDVLTPTDLPDETPEPTPVPTPEPTPLPTPKSATIRALGEIAIQDNLLAAAKGSDGSYDFSEMFSEIAGIMGGADYTIADVEGSLGGTADAAGETRMLTPPSLIQALKDCGVDMLNLANDHALDGGFADLQAAIENCKAAGMEYVGAAGSAEERGSAKVVDINGIKVGFVAYAESVNGLDAQVDADSLAYGLNLVTNSNPKNDVQACRDAGADIVVALASWGEMFNREVTQTQTTMAQILAQCGVDVIIGYNPHVIQRAVWLEMTNDAGAVTQRTLCMLSNGNFLSDARSQYSDSGVIFQFTIQEREDLGGFDIVSPAYIPTYVWRIENEDSTYDYRTLAAGQWLETAPEGMNYAQESRMRAVWAEAQSIMGTDVATVAKQ